MLTKTYILRLNTALQLKVLSIHKQWIQSKDLYSLIQVTTLLTIIWLHSCHFTIWYLPICIKNLLCRRKGQGEISHFQIIQLSPIVAISTISLKPYSIIMFFSNFLTNRANSSIFIKQNITNCCDTGNLLTVFKGTFPFAQVARICRCNMSMRSVELMLIYCFDLPATCWRQDTQ